LRFRVRDRARKSQIKHAPRLARPALAFGSQRPQRQSECRYSSRLV
jgi:hypothetical protein